MSADVDVVVVGAGFAGLSTAWNLRTAGARVAVFEASDRVGGRTETVQRGNLWLEAGGQWTGPGQHRVHSLADRYAVELFDTPDEGTGLQLSDGELRSLADRPAHQPVVAELDELAARVPGAEPWLAHDAAARDDLDVLSWLEQSVSSPEARRAMRQVLEGLMTVPAAEMSLLTVLHAARTSGSLAAALGIDGGAQEQRLIGGLHRLATHLADDLGGCINLSSAVTSLSQSADGVVVATGGQRVTASRVVVAAPPSTWSHIAFEPVLPVPYQDLIAFMPLGSVIKLQLVFERPFWRDAGYSGFVIDDSGPFAFMVDNSSPDRPEGVLVTFLSAGTARRFGDDQLGRRGSEVRRRMLIDHVVKTLGPRGSQAIDYFDRDWDAVPWIGGGYSGVMRPGGWQRVNVALRAPVGRIHWASAESARVWNGYVEGALDAAERAASEVLGHL
jgi:monoamine oxidase